jgi:hypothetical protein
MRYLHKGYNLEMLDLQEIYTSKLFRINFYASQLENIEEKHLSEITLTDLPI